MLLFNNGLNFNLTGSERAFQLIWNLSYFAAPYHPATNGTEKRANGTIVSILIKMAALDPLHWPQYLDVAILVYQISYNWVIGLSSFKALYVSEPAVIFSAMSLVDSLGPSSSTASMRLINNELVRLQALASASSSPLPLVSWSFYNADCLESTSFALVYMIIFYHHRPWEWSYKLPTTWLGPYRVINCQFNEYSIAAVNMGIVVNQFHCQFFRTYSPLVKRLKGQLLGISRVTPQMVLALNLLAQNQMLL